MQSPAQRLALRLEDAPEDLPARTELVQLLLRRGQVAQARALVTPELPPELLAELERAEARDPGGLLKVEGRAAPFSATCLGFTALFAVAVLPLALVLAWPKIQHWLDVRHHMAELEHGDFDARLRAIRWLEYDAEGSEVGRAMRLAEPVLRVDGLEPQQALAALRRARLSDRLLPWETRCDLFTRGLRHADAEVRRAAIGHFAKEKPAPTETAMQLLEQVWAEEPTQRSPELFGVLLRDPLGQGNQAKHAAHVDVIVRQALESDDPQLRAQGYANLDRLRVGKDEQAHWQDVVRGQIAAGDPRLSALRLGVQLGMPEAAEAILAQTRGLDRRSGGRARAKAAQLLATYPPATLQGWYDAAKDPSERSVLAQALRRAGVVVEDPYARKRKKR